MKKIVLIILLLISMNLYADTYVYLGVNTMEIVYSGICINAEVLFDGPSLTAQVCTGHEDEYDWLNYEIGLKYYFNKNRGFNIQIAFASELFTYSNISYSSFMPCMAARIGWRQLLWNKDPNKGLALDVNLGGGSTLDFTDFWPLAVLGIGYQF